jgi:hypothetical protein
MDKLRYDYNMNYMNIENAFAFLENKWHVFKHFDLKVDGGTRVIIEFVFE